MNKRPFIKTTDAETVEKLKSLGFTLIDEQSGVFTFLNDDNKKLIFDSNEPLKVTYSNILCV